MGVCRCWYGYEYGQDEVEFFFLGLMKTLPSCGCVYPRRVSVLARLDGYECICCPHHLCITCIITRTT
jgi:hypothetical protein